MAKEESKEAADVFAGCLSLMASAVVGTAATIVILGGLALGLGFQVEHWPWILGAVVVGIPMRGLATMLGYAAHKKIIG